MSRIWHGLFGNGASDEYRKLESEVPASRSAKAPGNKIETAKDKLAAAGSGRFIGTTHAVKKSQPTSLNDMEQHLLGKQASKK